MSLARLVVTAVRLEGRTKAEVARDYGVSPRWIYELCRRFDREGEAGLEPRSRRPHRSPCRTSELIEDEIVELRKELADLGVDAGAHTIAVHLVRRQGQGTVPSSPPLDSSLIVVSPTVCGKGPQPLPVPRMRHVPPGLDFRAAVHPNTPSPCI